MRTLSAAAVVLVPAVALALTVEGTKYPEKIELEGRTLHLVGAGMREKTIFKVDVYTMAAYTENRSCSHLKLVQADEAKMILMDFVRDVPGKKMMATMEDNFAKRTPKNAPDSLKAKIREFLTRFKEDAKDKARVKITYVPGKGTKITINGRQQGGIVEGYDFQKVLWDIWFNRDTCCPNLLEDIDGTCRTGK